MKLRHPIAFSGAVLLLSILLSAIVIQSQTQVLTETRKSALLLNLGQSRFEEGSHAPYLYPDDCTENAYSTAQVLYALYTLDALSSVEAQKGVDYIVSTQTSTIGNVTLWGWPGFLINRSWNILVNDLYVPHVILPALRVLHALDRVNKTSLVELSLLRYNETVGAFSEPVIKYRTPTGEEREESVCGFPLEFHTSMDVAYAMPNMISTYLGVSILAELDSLSVINTTKTTNWILSCKAENGAFKPFPEAQSRYSEGGLSLVSNPFYVDHYGTGIAFTYAAIGALRALGAKIEDVVDVEKVTSYISSCQELYPRDSAVFLAHVDDGHASYFASTYYAMMTLYYINAVQDEPEIVSKTVSYILRWLQDDYLRYEDSWPVPIRESEWYGLFVDFTPLQVTYLAVDILNATGNLHVLNQPTPIVSKAWLNLLAFSVIISFSTFGLSVAVMLSYRRIKARKAQNEIRSFS